MLTPEQRYRTDPVFHRLVTMLEVELEHGIFTPSELRESCILAATRVEARRSTADLYREAIERQDLDGTVSGTNRLTLRAQLEAMISARSTFANGPGIAAERELREFVIRISEVAESCAQRLGAT